MTTSQCLTIDIMTLNPLFMKLRNVNRLVDEIENASPDIAAGFLAKIAADIARNHGGFEGREYSVIARRHNVLRNLIRADCVTEAQHAGSFNSRTGVKTIR